MKSQTEVQEMSTEAQETQDMYAGKHAEENTAKEVYSKEELIEEIEGTPFRVAKEADGDGYFLTYGQYKLSGVKGTKEEVIEEAKIVTWSKVMTVVGVMLEQYGQYAELTEKIFKMQQTIENGHNKHSA